jgi:hypothetical protein
MEVCVTRCISLKCPHNVFRQCARELGGGPYYVPSLVSGSLQDSSFKDEAHGDSVMDYNLGNQDIAKESLALLK